MSYSNFSLREVKSKFGLLEERKTLFQHVIGQKPSYWLKQTLKFNEDAALISEKERSELLVSPILTELRQRNNKVFSVYSGANLDADSEQGLNGECDFILTKDINTFDLNYPIIQVVEAKKNDMDIGIPQCAAQMLGAKIFNEKKGTPLPKIYGCVTTGNDWIFMLLENDIIIVDNRIYYLTEIELILGAFQTIIDFYKKEIK